MLTVRTCTGSASKSTRDLHWNSQSCWYVLLALSVFSLCSAAFLSFLCAHGALAGPHENHSIKTTICPVFFAAFDQHMKCTTCKQKYTCKIAPLLKTGSQLVQSIPCQYGDNIHFNILIYQGIHCYTKVCNLHLDVSSSKSMTIKALNRYNLLKWKGIYKNYEPFTDQLQPIYFTWNGL